MLGSAASGLKTAGDYLRLSLRRNRAADYGRLRAAGDLDVAALLAGVSEAEWSDARASGERLLGRDEAGDGDGSLNDGDRRAVYHLVRALKPESMLEFGTHLGGSTLFAALALARNAMDGRPGRLVTVDIRDVNGPGGAWAEHAGARPPRDMIADIGMAERVAFVTESSLDFLDGTDETFDFCFLDGSHAAHHVYEEVQALQPALQDEAVVLLHDYFPGGMPLWPGREPLPGPHMAIERLRREGAPIEAIPLGDLPWPTKRGGNTTSLALLGRA